MKVIAEAGTCNGTLAYAIPAAVRAQQAGADMFKVQLYRKGSLFRPDAPAYGKGINRAETQWNDVGELLDYDGWVKVKNVCDSIGIEFFASAWDFDAVDALEAMGVSTYKIGSADITHRPLIEYVARTGKHIIMSTGASTGDEIKRAVDWIMNVNKDADPVLLACSLSYPTEPADAHVARLLGLKQLIPFCQVGYSDHTRGPAAAWVAASLGATVFEKHFTIEPDTGGDHDFAADIEEMTEVVKAARTAPMLFGNPELAPSQAEQDALVNARRSIAAAVDIPKGTTLDQTMLTYLRPGTGIPPFEAYKMLGLDYKGPIAKKPMRAMVNIAAGTLLDWKMIGYVGASLTVE